MNLSLMPVFASGYDVISGISFPKPFFSCWGGTRAELI